MKAAEELLKQSKIAVTEQRLTILNLFLNSSEPLTHQLVERMTNKTISRYTIYRTLLLFSRKGILHILPSQNSRLSYSLYLYAYKEGEQTHIHFVCRNCGKIDFMPGISIPDIKNQAVT